MKVTKSVIIDFNQLKTAIINMINSDEIDIPVGLDVTLQFYNGIQEEEVLSNAIKVTWEDNK